MGNPLHLFFSEMVGIQRELAAPAPSRTFLWFSGDATPGCVGWANWASREFFVEHADFSLPALPPNRSTDHINEVEFLTEIMRTVTWTFDHDYLAICGITDNSTSNIGIPMGNRNEKQGSN